jgi:hypothetical protein
MDERYQQKQVYVPLGTSETALSNQVEFLLRHVHPTQVIEAERKRESQRLPKYQAASQK